MSQVPNLRTFVVRFISPSNTRGARVSISEPAQEMLFGRTHRVTIPYDHRYNSCKEVALAHLEGLGFDIKCTGEDSKGYVIMADNWGMDFIELTK